MKEAQERSEAQKRADKKYREKAETKAMASEKTKVISFKLPAHEAEIIERKISQTGLTKAEFLRRAANNAKTEFEDLQALTTQESGIVIFENGNVIVGNWAGTCGIPRLDPWGTGLIGLNETMTLDETVKVVKNISLYVDKSRIIYDVNNDAKILHKYGGSIYKLTGGITVIAPKGWN